MPPPDQTLHGRHAISFLKKHVLRVMPNVEYRRIFEYSSQAQPFTVSKVTFA
jgi:hypothetical protein